MFDPNYTINQTVVYCDGKSCSYDVTVTSTDFSAISGHIRGEGWTIKRVGNDYEHFCSDCSEG